MKWLRAHRSQVQTKKKHQVILPIYPSLGGRSYLVLVAGGRYKGIPWMVRTPRSSTGFHYELWTSNTNTNSSQLNRSLITTSPKPTKIKTQKPQIKQVCSTYSKMKSSIIFQLQNYNNNILSIIPQTWSREGGQSCCFQ